MKNNNQSNWRVRFDERYDQYNPDNDTGVGIPTWNGADYQDLKDWFASELLRIREACEKMKKNPPNFIYQEHEDGYIEAITDILKVLDNQ